MQFQSNRLQFSKFGEDDFDLYLSLVSTLEVMKHITGRALMDREARIKFNELLKTNQEHSDLGVYKVLLKNNREFMGLGKIVDDRDKKAEIGYSILPQFRGQKFGSEIAASLVEMGKIIDGIEILTAITDPKNTPSNAILNKLGFEMHREGTFKGLPAYFFRYPLYPS